MEPGSITTNKLLNHSDVCVPGIHEMCSEGVGNSTTCQDITKVLKLNAVMLIIETNT